MSTSSIVRIYKKHQVVNSPEMVAVLPRFLITKGRLLLAIVHPRHSRAGGNPVCQPGSIF